MKRLISKHAWVVILLMTLSGCEQKPQSPYKIPSRYLDDSSPASVQAMKADWEAGKILERRTISILGKPQCVDILRDSSKTKTGFIQFDHPDKFRHFWISTEHYEAHAFEKDLVFVILKKPLDENLPLCKEDQPLALQSSTID